MSRNMKNCTWVLLAGVITVIAVRVWAGEYEPVWTIGRAIIANQSTRRGKTPQLLLKLSLRNIGVPGRMPVRIYARWIVTNRYRLPDRSVWTPSKQNVPRHATGRWIMPGADTRNKVRKLPPGMRLLGQYTREVRMNRTVILQVKLTALGQPEWNTRRLKLVIMTAAKVTDERAIRLPGTRQHNGNKY